MANVTAAPVVSWLHAYPPLPILASAAMAQPAGRLLGVSAVSSIWLRASPVVCALDALSVIVRCLVYCVLLRATPRQALVLVGTERFSDADTSDDASPSSTERGTTSRITAVAKATISMIIRLAGFALGIVPLVELIWFEPGGQDARWTAAWAWMFVAAYVLLEVVAAVYRWEQAQPQYTAADFELGEVEGLQGTIVAGSGENGMPYDGVSSRGSEEAPRESDERTVVNDDGNKVEDEDEDEDHQVDDAETADLLARGGERSDTAATTETPAGTTGAAADLEANSDKAHPYEYNNDPSSHPRLPAINAKFSTIESYVVGIGWLAHGLFLYWAFLDLIQPELNAHILQVDVTKNGGWEMVSRLSFSLYYLSLPFVFAALILVMALTLGAGALVAFIMLGFAKFVTSQLPPSVENWAGGLVPVVITGGCAILGGLATIVSFFMGSPWLGEYLLSSHSMWIYETITLELIVFILYMGACFTFYAVLKGLTGIFKNKYSQPDPAAPAPNTTRSTFNPRPSSSNPNPIAKDDAPKWAANLVVYTSDDSVALIAMALHTLLISWLWYAIRFAESSHWRQHWSDALIANVTTPHNGTMNGTANATASFAASIVASITPSSTPVQLF
ncbi:hypothetical protein Sste5346_006220 [Sporothrix stenoceras]|uniref:Uncharacterized protein n=1 Tax=Sporothrix stenoceras TaxID=5173 RepID=A0ABR3Z2H7_9PEZI